MRLLWSLPKAAPAILRHFMAYFELAAEDLQQSHRDFGARILASLILAVSLIFLVLVACLAVVAFTWDTPHRMAAIGWMGATFFVIALFAGLYRSRVIGGQAPFLGAVRREWSEDRVILDKILSDHRD